MPAGVLPRIYPNEDPEVVGRNKRLSVQPSFVWLLRIADPPQPLNK